MTDHHGKKKKKRKIPLALKVLLIFVVIIALALACVYIYARISLNKISRIDPETETETIAPEDETFSDYKIFDEEEDIEIVEMNPEDVQWPSVAADGSEVTHVLSDQNVANILLIGQDRRNGQGRQRSDTMILITINKNDKTIKMTSFLRDMYVQIPGYSDNRMNAAYQFGGMPLLDSVMETNFGIRVDGNVEVDFEGFRKCVDLLGGINVELTQDEADYICGRKRDVLYPQERRTDWDYLTEGMNHLNGEQALIHARNRSIGRSDFARTERQRNVLQAMFDKTKNADISTLLKMLDECLNVMTTDMTDGEITGYVMDVLTFGITTTESYRIPIDNSYTNAVIRGMQVLVPDLEENRAYLKEHLYGN